MVGKCVCEGASVLFFACSGASNVGQIANAAAIELTNQGRGKFYCLAGLGARIPAIVDATAHADYRIAIDGCKVGCARKTMEQAGIAVDKAVVVTELGIVKNHEFVWSAGEVERTMQATGACTPMAEAPESKCGCQGSEQGSICDCAR